MALENESIRTLARRVIKDILVLELGGLNDVHPIILCVCGRCAWCLLYSEAGGYQGL